MKVVFYIKWNKATEAHCCLLKIGVDILKYLKNDVKTQQMVWIMLLMALIYNLAEHEISFRSKAVCGAEGILCL